MTLTPDEIKARAEELLVEAERQAWNALAHGKESQFGYWAAKVVQVRELLGRSHEPSPFAGLRETARQVLRDRYLDKLSLGPKWLTEVEDRADVVMSVDSSGAIHVTKGVLLRSWVDLHEGA